MNGTCFYCDRAIGQPHAERCILIQRKVVVRVTIDYEIAVPAHWMQEDIEGYRNDSSWCSTNLIKELEELAEKDGCLCKSAHTEYVGEPPKNAPYLEE
jgi:hypothetical protein